MPTPQKPYPASLPASSVSYTRNTNGDLVTEISVDGDAHYLWTTPRGITSTFLDGASEYINALNAEDQAALIAWAEDVHERAASASPALQADLIGE